MAKGCGPLGCRNKQIFKRHIDDQTENGPVQSVIYSEDFNSTAVSSFGIPYWKYPVGWTLPAALTGYEAYGTDVVDNTVVAPQSDIIGGSGVRCPIMYNDSPNPFIITSAPFSTQGYTNITLDLLINRIAGAPVTILEWSDDNSSWNNIPFIQPIAGSGWNALTGLILPPQAENKTTIYIRISFMGDASNNFVAYDDLIVKGFS